MILNFLKNNKRKILLGLVVIIAISAVFANAGIVRTQAADTGTPAPVSGSLGGKTSVDDVQDTNSIILAITSFVGWLLSLMAALIDFAINLGDSVLNLEAVKTGWQIMLNFTNLGFILGIIVIAFATILRLESYALKQILWKLIVAALLVNFSLVIAGGFMSVSKITTDYFLQAISHGNLSDALAGTFQPQKLTQPKGDTGFWEKISNPLTTAINYMISLLFTAIFMLLMVLAFATLFIMLMVRIIALAFLLILSPVVWLLWIFPKTQQYWLKWWSEFIKWNFFAPAVMFFVYLTVLTSQHLKDIGNPSDKMMVDSSAAKAAAGVIMSNSEVLVHLANLTILLGMLFGGIYVANMFGIAGGNIGLSLAQSAGKGIVGWAGRKGMSGLKGAGSRVFGSEKAREWGEKLQKTQFGKLGRWTGAQLLLNQAGNAMSKVGVQQGEAAVKDAEKKYGHLSDVELGKRMHQFNAAERQFALQKMAKSNTLGMVAGGASQYITTKEENIWARGGQGKQFKDLEKSFGVNAKTNERIRKNGSEEEIRNSLNKWTAGLDLKDYNKLSTNILSKYDKDKNNLGFNGTQHEELRKMKTEAIMQHPGAIPGVRTKLKGESLIQFNSRISDHIKGIDEEFSATIGDEKIDTGKKDKDGEPILTSWKDAKDHEKVNYISKNMSDERIFKTLNKLLNVEKREKVSMENAVHVLKGLYNVNKNFGGSLLGGSFGYGAGEEKEEKK